MALNRNLPPVSTGPFAMVPRADVPRSTFATQHGHKTSFNAAAIIPVYCEEVLPGDVFKGKMTAFVRMATPVFPVMDNIYLESFFFFVPNRLVWSNWPKLMGERKNPTDSISYQVPVITSPVGGFAECSIYDYLGLPVAPQLVGATVSVNALPLRGINLIYNEWFRDQNVNNALPLNTTSDGPDAVGDYQLFVRNKRHDYFTSSLPWPTKNNDVPAIPLGSSAPVRTSVAAQVSGTQQQLHWKKVDGTEVPGSAYLGMYTGDTGYASGIGAQLGSLYPSNLYADLSSATGATLNAIRLAVATQQLLERDARGGTRYTEILRNHFGVMPQDARLDRPEYIGGGSMQLQTQAIPQTGAKKKVDDATDTPLGTLGGATTGADSHRFSAVCPEHGFIFGFVNVRADLTYWQGIHRMWTRRTRYDYYWPTFAFLGEQVVRNDEIYAQGTAADSAAFGYQERWAEYRYCPSRLTAKFRVKTGNLDQWHLAQQFTSLPALNATFLGENPPIVRVIAAGATADNMQFMFDSVFSIERTRAIPVRSVPGLLRF